MPYSHGVSLGALLFRDSMMEKQPTRIISFLFRSSLLISVLLGLIWVLPKGFQWLEQQNLLLSREKSTQPSKDDSLVLSLVSAAPQQRQSQLEAIASSSHKSLSRSRARYILASDLIEQQQGESALKYLQGLEKDYPQLAALILLQRGRAYQLMGEGDRARETWEKLIKNYPSSPAIVDAHYQLGQSNSQYWRSEAVRDAIALFPSHPRSQKIIRRLLAQNPEDSFQLLLLLAKYEKEPSTNQIRDRLVKEYSSQLKSEDWDAIATGYWQQGQYKKASDAYQKAPRNQRNAYRIARGMHLSKQTARAKKAYQTYVQEFPDAKETVLALGHLASLSKSTSAIAYLDTIISKFPDKAPKTLLRKAKLQGKQSAQQTRQLLLKKYPKSQAAAEYRWSLAEKAASADNIKEAMNMASLIVANNSDSNIAAEAAFWMGKWQQQLGNLEKSRTSFEYVLANHPQSYYAWRSAVFLGWDVGDFNNVRYLTPEVRVPNRRSLPKAGADTFKELYLLGQDRDAWDFWQAEMSDRKEDLTVDQQFTEGLVKIANGNYLRGINRIWSLKNRDDPQEQKYWQLLRQTPEYWQALFPFAFEKPILHWSQKRQVNPVLVVSLIRQESRFQTEIRSWAGATGLMQLMPATAKWVADTIKLPNYSLINPDDNINLGTWYLNHTHEIYNDNSLLAIASYNAGPGNVRKWKNRYGFYDPDVFVENIPFRETKNYVESVFGNYWNYLRIYNPQISQLLSRYSNREVSKK